MFKRSPRESAAAIGLLLATVVQAQPKQAPDRPDPLNPSAAVPALVHHSTLSGYRAAGEVKVGSWREANESVARIGGWRAYAREANQPEVPAATPSTPATPAAAPPPATKPTSPAPASAPAGQGAGKTN